MASLNHDVEVVSASNREKLIGALKSADEASISLQIKYASEPKDADKISIRSLKNMVQNKLKDVKAVVDDEAFDVAVALWEYQFVVDGDNELWFGDENAKLGLDVTLIERAQAFLHHWRLLIKAGERISCPDFMDEFECGNVSSGLVKLYRASVLRLAHEGETIPLGDDSSTETHDYTLQETEKAIMVHYLAYPKEQDRWFLIKKGDCKANFIVPRDAHESVVIALSNHIDEGGSEKKPATSSRASHDTFAFSEAKRSSVTVTPSEPTVGSINSLGDAESTTDVITTSISKPSTGTKKKTDQSTLDAPTKPLETSSHMSKAEIFEIVDNMSTEYETNIQTLRTRGGTANLGETDGNGGTSSRISRKRQAATTPKPTTVEKKGRGDLAPKAKEDDMLWICTECREAECMEDPDSDLVICDGKCNRAFHYHCCGIGETAVTSVESWICADCTKKKHRCAVCQEYGNDDDDVFLCEKKKCGMFFHESCLRMQNVDVRLVGVADACGEPKEALASDDGTVSAIRPVFTCPAHSCWTCTEDYIPEDEEEEGKSKAPKGRGKGRKNPKRNGNFLSKNDRLYRCMECPIAYHASCFPPTSRFHELAILCHEHSSSHKLPDLDLATSLQCQVEAVLDKKIEKLLQDKNAHSINKTAKAEHANVDGFNFFFSGLRGDGVTSDEATLVERLDSEMLEASEASIGKLPFCLPCDFKEEVHSKPPPYKHVHSLRYDPTNKPKRKAATGETCECHKSGQKLCDENCYNRMVMMECVGDKDKGNGERNLYWNCNMGPSCGNRKMSQRDIAKCKPKREQGKGWGLISIDGIEQGGLVQEYVGEIVDEKTKDERLVEWSKEHPNDPNFYLMQLEPGWYIDARLEANLSRFINHSCEPNCHLVQMNVNGFARVGIFALMDIAPGEFLSYDYQFDTKDGDKFVCRCGASKCRGTMKGGKHKTLDEPPKSAKQLWREAKAKYDRDVKFLEEVEKVEVACFSQVDITVPGADFSHEMVASGPSKKNKGSNTRPKVFLWRNAVLGSDFAARSRRESKKPAPKDALASADV